MDLLLNFKNKNNEDKYYESIDSYLSKISKTCLVFIIAIIPFYPYSETFVYKNSKEPKAEIARMTVLAFFYASATISFFVILKMRAKLKEHKKATRWLFDCFFFLFWWILCLLFLDILRKSTKSSDQLYSRMAARSGLCVGCESSF